MTIISRSAEIATKPVDVGNLPLGVRFFWHGRWYEWGQLSAVDTRSLAWLLEPNEHDGQVTTTGHSMLPGTIMEVPCSPDTESIPRHSFDHEDFGGGSPDDIVGWKDS